MNTTVFDAVLMDLPKVNNRQGNITSIQNCKDLPFEVKRIFYLYDIPGGATRGAHAHKACHQFLIAVSGSFNILLDDATTKREIELKRPYVGLHLPPGIWAAENNFASGSICLVLTSHEFDNDDYIRDYDVFKNYKK